MLAGTLACHGTGFPRAPAPFLRKGDGDSGGGQKVGKAPLSLGTEHPWVLPRLGRGSRVQEEQLCPGELIGSHLSGIISQPPSKPGERAALVSCR